MSVRAEMASPVGLKHGAVGFLGAVAESVGDVAVTGSVALGIPLVAAAAGFGAWLSWVLCLVGVVCVAYLCSSVARRHVTSGGMPGLLSAIRAPIAGPVVVLCILAFYVLIVPTNAVGVTLLFQNWLSTLSVSVNQFELFFVGLAVIAASVYLSLLGIKSAAVALLVIEGATLICVAILAIAILVKHPSQLFDSNQLSLHGVSLHPLLVGVTLGIFGFAGFETSTTLGHETREARTNIPRSLYASAIFCGLVFIVMAYLLTIGFTGSKETVGTSANPLADAAHLNGVGWLSSPLSLGVALSLFGATTALVTSGSRVIYTYARSGLLPRYFTKIDSRGQVPRRAIIWWGGVYGVVFWLFLVLNGSATLSVWGDMATMFTLVYVAAYIVAMLGFLRHGWSSRARVTMAVATVIGCAMFGYGLYDDMYPVPAFPANYYIYGGVGVAVAAVVVVVGLRLGRPALLRSLEAREPDES